MHRFASQRSGALGAVGALAGSLLGYGTGAARAEESAPAKAVPAPCKYVGFYLDAPSRAALIERWPASADQPSADYVLLQPRAQRAGGGYEASVYLPLMSATGVARVVGEASSAGGQRALLVEVAVEAGGAIEGVGGFVHSIAFTTEPAYLAKGPKAARSGAGASTGDAKGGGIDVAEGGAALMRAVVERGAAKGGKPWAGQLSELKDSASASWVGGVAARFEPVAPPLELRGTLCCADGWHGDVGAGEDGAAAAGGGCTTPFNGGVPYRCPLCVWMEAGPCKAPFLQWEACLEKNEEAG